FGAKYTSYRLNKQGSNYLLRETNRAYQEELTSQTIDSDKPGRSWTVYKNVPTWEEQVKKRVHEVAQKQYIEAHGTELEKQI
ncbi:15367_t:CDS:2, partial [Racocetra persica]